MKMHIKESGLRGLQFKALGTFANPFNLMCIFLIVFWILTWDQVVTINTIDGEKITFYEHRQEKFYTRSEALSYIANNLDKNSHNVDLNKKDDIKK